MPYLLAQKAAEAEAENAKKPAHPRPKRNSGQGAPVNPPADSDELALAFIAEPAQQQDAKAQELGLQMMLQMAEDIKVVPVHDVLLRTGGGVNSVLTVDSSFYSATTNEYPPAGDFRVVGKVTHVLQGDRTINLTRRTVLGATSPEIAQEVITGLNNEGLSLDVPDPIVEAPGLQILPMAIFL